MGEATTVLVHGGGATGRAWDRLVPHLPGPVCAVDLPGRGESPADLATIAVEDEVAAVVAAIEGQAGDDVVLVAHSSGGLVVPGVVAASPGRVRAVVLVAALVPPEGGCGLDCMKPVHREGLVASVEQAAATGGPAITLPGPPADPEPFRTAYGGDALTDDELAFVVDPLRCVPDTVHHYFQPVHWSQAADVAVTYVHTERDRPVAPARQREMIALLPGPASVVTMPTGHLPMVTDPERLAAAIVAAG
ncbi:alpha/beta hydrolase [Iamia sp. SCSIO 61187]|uniref:alpha/beta fold hydrolase n=1 Tax=Iamia sp. SCSIO 61187 TaxID=2722752 RepID=UPI001C6388DB|nr:alpha/beta hydrolase [Iamia sp. SCSIO 61187]QYG91979.1 alpha/beta hydrolase [Iamia sp. SCSIO 61187]